MNRSYTGRMFKKPVAEKIQVKTRNCLMCSNKFQSEHFGERICKECKKTSDWRQPSATTHHENLRGVK